MRKAILAIVLMFSILLFSTGAQATITSSKLFFENGTNAVLKFDSDTEAYSDGSTANQNAFLEVCASSSSELQNNFIGLFYKVGNKTKAVHVLPAQIVNLDANNCTSVDLDFSFFKAFYPAIPALGISSSTDFSTANFTDLTSATGFLKGNYTVRYFASGTDIVARVSHALTDANSDIGTVQNFIILGVLNSTGDVIASEILSLNQSTTLPAPTGFAFLVNGIFINQTVCASGSALCADGTCSTDCATTGGGAAGCIGAANSACEVGEGCACSDCLNLQDSCASGLVCLSTELCDTNVSAAPSAAAAPSGPSGGPPAPRHCTFTNTFDGINPGEIEIIRINDVCTSLTKIVGKIKVFVPNLGIIADGNATLPFDAPQWGKPYQFYNIDSNLEDNADVVILQFRVNKTWMMENNINELGGVKLNRFTDRWVRLPTYKVGEQDGFVLYEAFSTGLSYFAITGEETEVIIPFCGDNRCVAGETSRSCPQDCPAPAILPIIIAFAPKFGTLLFLIVAIITIIAGIAVAYHHKVAKKPMPEIEIPLPEITLPELPKIEMPSVVREIKEEVRPEIHELHPGQPVKAPRLAPAVLVRTLPKSMRRLQKKAESARRKIESELHANGLLREAARIKAEQFAKPSPKPLVVPELRDIKHEVRLAERELKGEVPKAKPAPTPKQVYRTYHKIAPKDVKKLTKAMAKSLKDVEEAVEKVSKEVKK